MRNGSTEPSLAVESAEPTDPIPFPQEDVEQSIASRFQQVVSRVPDRPALRDEERLYTYAELGRLAGRIASALARRAGAAPATVALVLPHDARAPLGFLAAAKSGAISVPMDPMWPPQRLEELLLDVGAAAALTDDAGAALLEGLHSWGGRVVRIDEALSEGEAAACPDRSATDAAAIFYSSGSTGRPKGIVWSHATALNSARNHGIAIDVTPADRLAWLTPISFGAAQVPILTGLLSGACVLSVAVKRRGLNALAEWLVSERVTVLPSVTSLWRQLAGQLPDGENFPDLRFVKLGGEPVLRSDAELFRRRFHRGCVLVNGLGLTEAAGRVSVYRWTGGALPDGPTLPLGYAVDGVELLILDEAGRPLPPGEVGEVAVRGRYLAPGYWRMPELTGEKFVRSGEDGTRTFLTGDLGRMSPDGCLIGLGRKDTKLKIRGHSVETLEVEAALLALDGVTQAAVIGRKSSGSEKLVAFLVPSPGRSLAASELRRSLRRRLPEYMIPSSFVSLPSLPALPSGKLDRRSLLSMEIALDTGGERVPPRDELELQLAEIWKRALRRAEIGVTDDFFDLGGDSLDAVRVFAMMERWLRINLPLTELAGHPTIESLARALRERDPKAARSSAILLNAGESRLRFFCVPGAGSDAFALLELARRLGPEHTFYALQHAGIDGTRPFFMTVEEMAARFLRDVRAIQPMGPYCLGGTSFGGVVAYEMAQQLAARGERVALLALIEAYGPRYPRLRREALVRHLPSLVLRWLLPIGRKGEATRANLKLGIRERMHRMRAVVDLRLRFRKSPPPYALRFIYLQEVCFRAHRRYRFSPYDGPILLFRAEQQPPASLYELCDDMGWAPLARGGLEIEEIPGYHGAHIREPHVRGLAARLARRLLEADGGADGSFDELTPRTHEIWNQIAGWWDEQVGDDGRPETRALALPVLDRFLGATPGERVLDVACGNGWYARQLARSGVHVVGFDFSEELIERARARTAAAKLEGTFHVLDATRAEQLLTLGESSFDAAVCVMGLMDMTGVDQLFQALSRLLRPNGRFVFSIVDPGAGNLANASPRQPLMNIGIEGQPMPHYYFHRPLPMLLDSAKRAGFLLEAREEQGAQHLGGTPDPRRMALFVARLRLRGMG